MFSKPVITPKMMPPIKANAVSSQSASPSQASSSSSSSSLSSSSSSAHMHLRNLVAGVSGGAISTLILHPLDLIKVRFQVNEGIGVAHRPQYTGIIDAMSCIVRQQGIQGLYQGVAPNVWGTAASWGVYFLCYNALKTHLQGGDRCSTLNAMTHMMVAANAGVVTLLFTNPLWVSKTRLCLQYDHISSNGIKLTNTTYYKGMTDCLCKIYKIEGIRGLYKGFVPGLLGVAHGSIQFMVYEELKKYYNSHRHVQPNEKLKTVEYLFFAAVSKIIASGLTYPYQVLRARLQDQHHHYSGVIDVIKQTYRMEGTRGFFKGFTPYLCHVTPNICIVFLIYETVTNY